MPHIRRGKEKRKGIATLTPSSLQLVRKGEKKRRTNRRIPGEKEKGEGGVLLSFLSQLVGVAARYEEGRKRKEEVLEQRLQKA